MAVSSVLFDADGVLQTAGPLFTHVERRYGWSRERLRDFFRQVFEQRPGYFGYETGKGDPVAAITEALPRWGFPGCAETFIREWLTLGTVPDPSAFSLVATLRRHGIRCGLATNQDPLRARYMDEDLGYRKLFDDHFYSADLGVAKPDPEFFRTALRAVATDPQQVLFIDDHEPNVQAARDCGMHAELHRPGDDLRETLTAYGLPV